MTDKAVLVTAGGRNDLEIEMPAEGAGVRVVMGGVAMVFGRDGTKVPPPNASSAVVDLLCYGSPEPLGFDPLRPTEKFDFVIGRRPGFVKGRPGLWWTVNGHMYPDVPMFMVVEGDVVRMKIENNSGTVHPMHLHGHHVVVLSRSGVEATG